MSSLRMPLVAASLALVVFGCERKEADDLPPRSTSPLAAVGIATSAARGGSNAGAREVRALENVARTMDGLADAHRRARSPSGPGTAVRDADGAARNITRMLRDTQARARKMKADAKAVEGRLHRSEEPVKRLQRTVAQEKRRLEAEAKARAAEEAKAKADAAVSIEGNAEASSDAAKP